MPPPSKADYIAQIEADLANEHEDEAVLKERLEIVHRATEDNVRELYVEHVVQSQVVAHDEVPEGT